MTLKRQKRGADARVGTDTSSSSGAWRIRKRAKPGRYYVVASTKKFVDGNGDTIVCKRGKSATKRVR